MGKSKLIAVKLESLVFDYRFNESDLRDLFSAVGTVADVMLLDEVEAPDIAIIEFADSEMASAAVEKFNGSQFNIEGFTAVVSVTELTPEIERALLVKAHILSSSGEAAIDPYRHTDKFGRYVARYLVGADKMSAEYSVIGRLVGVGGENVKSIFKTTGAHVKVLGKARAAEDPLYVRVSAESKEAFESGKKLTEQLIQETYDDYAKWCDRHYIPVPPIRLNVIEGSEVLRPFGRLSAYYFS